MGMIQLSNTAHRKCGGLVYKTKMGNYFCKKCWVVIDASLGDKRLEEEIIWNTKRMSVRRSV